MQMRRLFSLPTKTPDEMEKDVDAWWIVLQNIPTDEILPSYEHACLHHTSPYPLAGTEVYQSYLRRQGVSPTPASEVNVCGVCGEAGNHGELCPLRNREL